MMVSASPQSPTSKPDTMEWRKPGEPFRGLPKSRGGGRGAGRGRGGGRGTGRGIRESSEQAEKNVVSSPSTPSMKDTLPSPSDTIPSGRTSRQKPPRKTSTATSEESLRPPPPPQSSRPPNRGRRSRQSTRTPNLTSNPPANKHLTVESSGRKALTGPPTPSGSSKDLPPHLSPSDTPSFDIRTNIDALVERVRAVAMDRPHTPGSHIDWAGDDDDSLPDLDDWGLTSSKGGSVGDKQDRISPILRDTKLFPLPNVSLAKDNISDDSEKPLPESALTTAVESLKDEDKRESALPRGAEAFPEFTPRPHKVEKVRSKRGTRSRGNSRTQLAPPAIEIQDFTTPDSLAPSRSRTSSPTTVTHTSPKPEVSQPSSQSSSIKLPLHPSLPPKPLIPIEHVRPRTQNNTASATPMRDLIPTKPVPMMDNQIKSEDPKPVEHPAAITSEKPKLEEEHKVVPNLVPLVPLQELPPRAFNPAHGRAHTEGRFTNIRTPHSAPTSTFSPSTSFHDSSSASPSRGAGLQHTRTHSSPPTGHVVRAPHATRPVLTGDAISRITRTLVTAGGMSSRREPASVPLTKE